MTHWTFFLFFEEPFVNNFQSVRSQLPLILVGDKTRNHIVHEEFFEEKKDAKIILDDHCVIQVLPNDSNVNTIVEKWRHFPILDPWPSLLTQARLSNGNLACLTILCTNKTTLVQ